MKKLADTEIIESINNGNIDDFSLIVDRYKDRAYSMLKRMLKNEMDAEEALQDSFLKAFNSLNKFRNESSFATYFYRIVYNTAITVLNAKKRKFSQEMFSIDEEIELGVFDNEVYSRTEDSSGYIYKMIDKLPVKHALVLVMFYIDGMSLNEISQVLGLSIVNVKVMLYRSRNSLRDLLMKHNFHKEYL